MSSPSYPGGGGKITTDASQKPPRKITRPLRVFKSVIRSVRTGGKR